MFKQPNELELTDGYIATSTLLTRNKKTTKNNHKFKGKPQNK